MCDVCCQELGGWCKAFTKTERLLTILESILLIVFISFLTFLILHLIVCSKQETGSPEIKFKSKVPGPSYEISTPRPTLAPDVQCTWEPSKKTKATTHYYEQFPLTYSSETEQLDTKDIEPNAKGTTSVDNMEERAAVEETDGEEPEVGFDKFVLALVKIKPRREIIFGCVLTIVSRYWTLTAASCIEAIEEVDSLDAFVMLEGYGAGGGGGGAGRAHAVADVRVHPLYGGANRSYDVAALRSDDRLPPGPRGYLRLPTMLDYLLLTIGERLVILGYGNFRSVETDTTLRSVRAVHVYSLPMRACAAEEAESWALRHLARPGALQQGSCAAADLCAGPLHARGLPCNYCSGTPLLAGERLMGVMANNRQCGESCEPARYVNLAALRDWIDATLLSDQMS